MEDDKAQAIGDSYYMYTERLQNRLLMTFEVAARMISFFHSNSRN